MTLGQLDANIQKNRLDPYLAPHVKTNSERISDVLKVRARTTKPFNENVGVNMYGFGLDDSFSGLISKA